MKDSTKKGIEERKRRFAELEGKGKETTSNEEEVEYTCPDCGKKLEKSDTECPKCGTEFDDGEDEIKLPSITSIIGLAIGLLLLSVMFSVMLK